LFVSGGFPRCVLDSAELQRLEMRAGNMKHVNDSTCLGNLPDVETLSLLDENAGMRRTKAAAVVDGGR
jgi:hypothetical protein